MKLKELLKAATNTLVAEIEIKNVVKDSRKVEPGDAFFCLKWFKVDGHDFGIKAAEAGAAVVICERDLGLENQLIVKDTRKAYAEMCSAYFGDPAEKLKIIGVTGTNGKTSTATEVKFLLESFDRKVGMIGTVQNMIGDEIYPVTNTTPDPYELHGLFSKMVAANCEYCVMEVSSHAIDMERVYGIHYEACAFTNLTQDHLDYHKTMENYLETKTRIFSRCDHAVINADDPYAEAFMNASECPVITYGVHQNAALKAINTEYKVDGVDFTIVLNDVSENVSLKIPGEFSVYNALAAAALLISMGFPIDKTMSMLSQLPHVKGRVEVVPTGMDFMVVIDYAHSPDGLENVLQALNKIKQCRLVTLFGCGGDRDKTKRPIMAKIAAQYSDFVIVTSDNPRSEEPEAIIADILVGLENSDVPSVTITDRIQAIEYAVKTAQKDDIILLAGKGHETYQILKDRTIHLDEREVIRDALKKL